MPPTLPLRSERSRTSTLGAKLARRMLLALSLARTFSTAASSAGCDLSALPSAAFGVCGMALVSAVIGSSALVGATPTRRW